MANDDLSRQKNKLGEFNNIEFNNNERDTNARSGTRLGMTPALITVCIFSSLPSER